MDLLARARSVAAFGAVLWTLGLLGGLHPAQAQYAEQTGPANPFDGIAVATTPAAVDAITGDFNTDGAVDLLVFDGAAERYYENDGAGTFTEQTGAANPFSAAPAFSTRGRTFIGDVDADGDVDLVVFESTGGGAGTLVLVENTDGSTYVRQTGPANPFNGIPVRGNPATVDAIMGDFGGDAGPDLLAYDGTTERYYENDGAGAFTEQTGAANPFSGLATAFWTKTTTLVHDFDGDGDVDIAFRDGTGDATNWQYREQADGAFIARTGSANPLSGVAADATGNSVAIAVGDFDLDGRPDLITADAGTQRYYTQDSSGSYAEVTDGATPFDNASADLALQVKAGTAVQDTDLDNDPDVLVADAARGAFRFIERTNASLALSDGSADGLDFTAGATPGTANNAVGLLGLSAATPGAVLGSLTITNGAPGLSGIEAARLFWSEDKVLDVGTDPQLGAVAIDVQSAPPIIAFEALNRPIPVAARYLIIALDVAADASGGDVQFTLDQLTDLEQRGGAIATVNGQDPSTMAGLPLSNATTPLPVELAGFDARHTHRQAAARESITLQWQTFSETDNAGFEVQRRTNRAWQSIARLEGAGTTNEPQAYRFEDRQLPYAADSLSYRLRQIDTDGTESFSEAVTVARQVATAELLPTSPNPVQGAATVRFAVPKRQAVRIALYDLMGRRVQTVLNATAAGRTEISLDVSGLASGTYFLRMQTARHIETQRLTVVR